MLGNSIRMNLTDSRSGQIMSLECAFPRLRWCPLSRHVIPLLLEGIIVTFRWPERSRRAVSIGLPSIMMHVILPKHMTSARGINCPQTLLLRLSYLTYGVLTSLSPREFIWTEVYLGGCWLCVKMEGSCSTPKQWRKVCYPFIEKEHLQQVWRSTSYYKCQGFCCLRSMEWSTGLLLPIIHKQVDRWSNCEVKSILSKLVKANRTDCSQKLDDALSVYKTAYKTQLECLLIHWCLEKCVIYWWSLGTNLLGHWKSWAWIGKKPPIKS